MLRRPSASNGYARGQGGGGRGSAYRRPGAAAEHRRNPAVQCFFDLLWADEVDVAVDTAGSDDHAFTGDDFSGRADHDRHAGLDVWVAGFTNRRDQAILQADVGFDDAPCRRGLLYRRRI